MAEGFADCSTYSILLYGILLNRLQDVLSNVLVTRQEFVKLLDLGLAKLTDHKEADSTVTDLAGDGQILGASSRPEFS